MTDLKLGKKIVGIEHETYFRSGYLSQPRR